MRVVIFVLLPAIVFAQSGTGGEEIAENAENFRRLYGIASKVMELGGTFLGGNGGGGGSGYDEVRPRFQGVRSFTEDNSILSGGSQSGGINSMAKMLKEYQGMFANANFVQQTTTTTTERPSGFKSILDSFLGTGNSGGDSDSENLPPPPSPKPRQQGNLFSSLLGGGGGGRGSSSSGSSGSAPSNSEAAQLFGNFFGMMTTPTTTTTTEATPVQKIMSMFVPQSENRESSSSRGKINFLELFGMAPRTTTTTAQPPLQALFAPNKPYNGSPEDLDGIMNALLRSNARPTRQEPASILSQFFGKK